MPQTTIPSDITWDLEPVVNVEVSEEFGDFLEAPAKEETESNTKRKESKQEKPKKEEVKKDSIWDEAKDILDMNNLMKPSTDQYGVGNRENVYSVLYGKSNQFKY